MTSSHVFAIARQMVVVVGAAGFLAGCSYSAPSLMSAAPQLTAINPASAALRALPPPSKRIAVAVYDLPDLTGQYAETTNGSQGLSRAVTQGGSALLIKSLQDAGERHWFTVLDRSRLDDTLKERQIVTEMRRLYRGEDQVSPAAMPPLMHASIIIEGSISGYDTFNQTGGLGAQYLGIGASTSWQQDTVTVNLRAVSTNTSEVLANVSVQKKIASISLQGNVFRYVALDRLLEIEGGLTSNEPKQVAVEKAIDKAVYALIVEGVRVGLWNFANPTAGKAVVSAYLDEKYDGKVPADAAKALAPATRNAASVVQTVPVKIVQPQTPATTTAPPATPMNNGAPPPPANPNEIIG